jgi:RsiW-degrading membrane proteinase PrsW (M82 family)
VTGLWLAYFALAVGLMTYGAVLLWLGFRRPTRTAETPLRVVMVLALLAAVAGTVAAAIMEGPAPRP